MKEFPQGFIIEAMVNLVIERDLIVDTEPFLRKLEAVKPYIIRNADKTLSEGEYLQTPAQLAQYKQFSQCINCTLCYAACPQIALNEDFIGPAALALAFRYNRDNRDEGQQERMAVMNTYDGLWPCTFVGYCSEVCPKSVDPASAIQQSKMDGTIDWTVAMFPEAIRKHLQGSNTNTKGKEHD
jgi:fumarate reductase iron-sulfur subunit